MVKSTKVGSAALIKHNGRPAHEIVHIVAWLVEMLLKKFLVDEASRVLPVLGPAIREDVVYAKLIWELLGPLIER